MKRLNMSNYQPNETSESEGRMEAKAETVGKGGDKSLCHARECSAQCLQRDFTPSFPCEVLLEGD